MPPLASTLSNDKRIQIISTPPNNPRRKAINDITDALAQSVIDKGLLIEAGWISLQAAIYPDGVPEEKKKELRTAFFIGAQHLWGSIFGVLTEDKEPTDQDIINMSLIEEELDGFLREFKHDHGIDDPDIGPATPESVN